MAPTTHPLSPFYYRGFKAYREKHIREKHIVKLVDKCLKGMAPSYFSRYFKLKRHNVHDYDTRKKNKIVIDRVKLESTKRAFFYKGADIFNYCL